MARSIILMLRGVAIAMGLAVIMTAIWTGMGGTARSESPVESSKLIIHSAAETNSNGLRELTGGGRRYSANVRRARQWARDHTTHRGFRCLHILWDRESHWSVHARTGRAYGIPQALPGRKMRSAGADWRTNALTQVRWGLHYIRSRYRTMCHALRFQFQWGWY